jgi:alpha-1,6-mannosyltransferase
VRIVDVNEFYSPTGGGVRTYLDRKMAILAQRGHELIVVAPGREDREEVRASGGRILWVRAPAMPFDKNYGLFWGADPITVLLDRLDPDVVECSSPWRPAWIVAGWQGRAAKAFFMHNDNVEAYAKMWLERVARPERIERAFAWYSRYMNRFLSRFDTVVTNGPALTKRMQARGVRVDATVTLGIEREQFSPALHDEALRAELLAECGLPPAGHLLIGVGRHHREKRWPMVIDAVRAAGDRLPVGLVLLGHGMETRALERRAAGCSRIRLLPPVYDRPRLARIMASADAFIHGSSAEPFGLVAYEARASGLPMIVPDEGGAFEAAEPDFAETFRAKDADACADAIGRLFARDPAMLRQAARAAAASVRSDEEHAEALIAHYEAVIAARSVERVSASLGA